MVTGQVKIDGFYTYGVVTDIIPDELIQLDTPIGTCGRHPNQVTLIAEEEWTEDQREWHEYVVKDYNDHKALEPDFV